MQNEIKVQQGLKAWILWAALTLSIPIYLIVGYFVTRNPVGEHNLDPNLKHILMILACVMVAGSFAVATISKTIQSRSSTRRLSDEQSPPMDFNRWLTFNIIRWALHESIAIYGLVLTIISANLSEMIPFAIAAVALNLLSMPSAQQGETKEII